MCLLCGCECVCRVDVNVLVVDVLICCAPVQMCACLSCLPSMSDEEETAGERCVRV